MHGWCALLAAAFLIACGSDDDSAPAPTPTATAAPVAPTPTALPVAPGAGMITHIIDAIVDDLGRIAVDFVLTDDAGRAIRPTLSATQNPLEARVRFTAARFERYAGGGDLGTAFERYVNIVNATRPAYDGRGSLEAIDLGRGLFRFTFAVTLADGSDPTASYSIGMQADRSAGGRTYSANPVFDFVPAGGEPSIRAGVATAQCNTCHDPLQAHGSRFEVRLCITCHTEAAVDELGRSVDFRDMVHKIHAGVDLPSVADGPPGAYYGLFSSFQRQDIVFARKGDDGGVTGVRFPRPLSDCTSCHSDAPTADYHTSKASTVACTSCHDDVNPSLQDSAAGPPGTNHFEQRGFADGQCAACHEAQMQEEFDTSVAGSHVIPERSTQLAGLAVIIDAIDDHRAQQTPLISFRVTDDGGIPLTDLSQLNRLAFVFAGPTEDYDRYTTAVAVGGGAGGMLVGPDAGGQFQYRPPAALPADATGTWTLGAEARRNVTVGGRTVNEAAVNPVVAFAVDESPPAARRDVVADDNCTACHGEFSRGFSVHGNLRNRVEMCVLCHVANESDYARRSRDADAVAAGDRNETIDFKVMIHKIHRGEHLQRQPYLLYGFGPPPANFSVHDFSHLLYPGDLRNCQACHLPATWTLPPFPGGALATRITAIDPQDGSEVDIGHVGPITSACTSCHDGESARIHASGQTAANGDESCTVCHAEGRPFPVSAAHGH